MRIRFTIRQFLLLGVTACCVGAALLAVGLRGNRAAAKIEALGGACIVRHPDWWYPAGVWPNDVVDVYLWEADTEDYSFLAECPHLENLNLFGCKTFTDDDVAVLTRLSALVNLGLRGSGLTRQGIDAITGSKLRSLDLSDTELDDACLLHLLRLPALEDVVAKDTAVTRAGADRFVEKSDNAWVIRN